MVVPWRGGCRHRERAWDFTRSTYAERLPGWDVICAELPPDRPWSKAEAAMPAIAAHVRSGTVTVVADADVWCDGLESAVEAVVSGAAEWAIPHQTVYRLNEAGTESFISGAGGWKGQLAQRAYCGRAGGGFVIASRERMLAVPPDPRFVGWGQEDESWARALTCLAGKPWRGAADLVHLWHPPQERWKRRVGSREGWQLCSRYSAAARNPDQMRALLEEIHAFQPDQPAVHAAAPAR